jgi:hypothetical protein
MVEPTKSHKVELGIELCLELAIALYQLGAEHMELPHSFLFGLFLWGAATALAIRMFWIFPWWENRLSRLEKGLISAIVVGVFILIAYQPVVTAYRKHVETKTTPQSAHQNVPNEPNTETPSVTLTPQANSAKNADSRSQSKKKVPSAKPPVTPNVTTSGEKSPAIGSITQGAGSALSVNQQGGITAGTVNIGTPPLPTPTVKICATYPDVVAEEDFKSVVTFTTSSQLPRPWFSLFFDGPVLEGNVGRVRGSYRYTHARADKLPNPERSFMFRTVGMELGGTSNWFPSDGPIQATIPSKGRVKLIGVLGGGGDDPLWYLR